MNSIITRSNIYITIYIFISQDCTDRYTSPLLFISCIFYNVFVVYRISILLINIHSQYAKITLLIRSSEQKKLNSINTPIHSIQIYTHLEINNDHYTSQNH